MDKLISRIGVVNQEFETFNLKSVLTKNDAGDWGDEPKIDAIGIIRSTNFRNNGKLDLTNVAYRSLKPHKQIEKKVFEGDILVERSGGSDVQPVGRVGYVNSEIAKENFAFANFIQRISIDENIDPKFLHYCLQQMYEMGITETMQNQTTGIRNLDWKQYIKSEFPKPPKTEQTAIATILSKVDEAIEATENSIKAAEKVKKALMQNLLSGKLKPDGSQRKEEEFYSDEKFGKVPIGWEVKQLKEISDLQRGKFSHRPRNEERFYNGRHPFIQTSDIVNSVFYLKKHSQTLSDLGVTVSKKFDKRTIIITIAANIGDVAITKYDVFFPDSLIGIKANEEIINSEFLLISLMTKKRLLNQVSTESAQKNINYGNLRPLPIYFPKKPIEQEKITTVIKNIFETIEEKQTKIINLQRLKKSLMQNLLTGKVRVDLKKMNQLIGNL
jgi:type I restriction enzyme S subunit